MTDTAQRPAAGPVPALEARIANFEQLVAKAAHALGRSELAPETADASADAQAITIVVAGETSRGKSTLINALLGRPALLSSAADVTTNVYTVVRHATEERAHVALKSGATVDVPLTDVGRWTTIDMNPDNVEGVRSVELFIDAPLLSGGLLLVDTPGVGGIEAAHAEMTLFALRSADALLFVKDAHAPISGPEGAFLARAADRLETVIICLTKVDQFPAWEAVAAQDRDFLRTYLPRFAEAPILPVSAHHAFRAMEAGSASPPRHARLRELSGIDQLLASIEAKVVAPGTSLRLGNRARGALTKIDELERTVRARAAAADGDTGPQAELARTQGRIQQFRQESASWNTQLGDDLQRLRLTLLQAINKEFLAIRVDLPPNRLTKPDDLQYLPTELKGRLDDLVLRLNARLAEGIAEITRLLAERLSLEGIDIRPARIDLDLDLGPGIDQGHGESDAEKVAGWTRSLMSMTGPVTTLKVFAVADPVLLGLGLMAGIGLAVVERAKGTKVRDLAEARQRWSGLVSEATGTASVDIPPQLEMRFLDIRAAIVAEVRAAVDRRLAHLVKEENELKTVVAAKLKVRKRIVADANTDLARLAEYRKRAEGLLREASLGASLAARARRADGGTPPAAGAPAIATDEPIDAPEGSAR